MENQHSSKTNFAFQKTVAIVGIGLFIGKLIAWHLTNSDAVFSDAMESINWDAVYEKARNFGTGLADFLNGLFVDTSLFSSLGKTIAGSLNTALHALNSFGTTFDWTGFY